MTGATPGPTSVQWLRNDGAIKRILTICLCRVHPRIFTIVPSCHRAGIEIPGQISAGFESGKPQNRPAGRQKADFEAFPISIRPKSGRGRNPARSGPEERPRPRPSPRFASGPATTLEYSPFVAVGLAQNRHLIQSAPKKSDIQELGCMLGLHSTNKTTCDATNLFC